MKFFKILIISLFLACFSFTHSQSNAVRVNIESIKSEKGQVILALFKTEDQFDKEKPFKSIILDKKSIKNGRLSLTVDLPVGTYGISLLDDENNNKLMDYSFFGIPEEGFGFSNFVHSGFSKPDLKVFTVSIQNKKEQSINFNIRYM